MSDTHPNTYAMDANAKAKIEQHYEIIRLNNRIAALEAQNKKLVEALKHMTVEFKHDDHNLAFPNCLCQSHQNYHAALDLLIEVGQ